MSKHTSEYSTIPVAEEAFIHGVRIALIILGLMVALPGFVIGAELSHMFGAVDAIKSSLIGGAILTVIAVMGGIAGAKSRLSTYMLVIDAFGTRGAILANGLISVLLIGWFGVIAMMFGNALTSSEPTLFQGVSVKHLALAGIILMVSTTLIGIRALDILSMFATPLKVGLLLWIVSLVFLKGHWTEVWSYAPTVKVPLGNGISIVAGALIIGATLAPDLCRFARTPLQASLAVASTYGIGFPLILILSGIPSLMTGEKDLVAIMLIMGLGLPAMLVILLTAWATNSFNLYAATLVISTARPQQPRWQLVLIAGTIGTVFGLAGISDKLTNYLMWTSIAIPPIAGVYLMNFYLKTYWKARLSQATWRLDALASWALGTSFAALAGRVGINITPVPAIDSILVAALFYAAFRWFADAKISQLSD